jgi:hypothetical protein
MLVGFLQHVRLALRSSYRIVVSSFCSERVNSEWQNSQRVARVIAFYAQSHFSHARRVTRERCFFLHFVGEARPRP